MKEFIKNLFGKKKDIDTKPIYSISDIEIPLTRKDTHIQIFKGDLDFYEAERLAKMGHTIRRTSWTSDLVYRYVNGYYIGFSPSDQHKSKFRLNQMTRENWEATDWVSLGYKKYA